MEGICQLFSAYFGSVYDDPITHSSHPDFSNRCAHILTELSVGDRDVLHRLESLDVNKGPGPDGIPSRFYRHSARELCLPLSLIFNQSLSLGVFPSTWKVAHIIPIHKSGDSSNCENYRPIRLLLCPGKVFESLVYDHLYHQIKSQLSQRQHGFIKNRSTISNLLEYKTYICKAFDSGGQVDSVYTDFKKAFDKVDHRLLCHKIDGLGIHGSLLR